MGLRNTGRTRFGPFVVNSGLGGPASVSVRVGPVTWRLWSRTQAGGMSSIDLPGPFSYRPSIRRRARGSGGRRRR